MPYPFSAARISVKLAGSSLMFALPIALLTFFTVRGLDKDIDFASMEIKGNAVLRPMIRLLESLPDGGTRPAAVDQAFADLGKAMSLHGEALLFTPAELAKRGREKQAPPRVESAWRALRGNTPAPEALDALTADVRVMIAHAGDISNLILDPDLDSYYVMDAVLLALPQTLDRTARAVRQGAELAALPELGLAERKLLAVQAAMLREADQERIEASLNTALKEDENFYGRSDSLQRAVPARLKAYSEAASALAQALEALSEGKPAKPAEIRALGERAMAESIRLWTVCSAELDALLEKRIADYQSRKLRALGLSLSALAVAGLLVTFISRGIVRQLDAIRAFARRVAQGDLDARPQGRATGELAELENDLAVMVKEQRGRLGYAQGLQRSFKVPLLVADNEARVTFTNRELLDFIEVQGEPEDWLGLTVAELVRNDATKETVMSKCLKNNVCVYKAEIEFVTRKGNHRVALVDSDLLHDLDGNVLGVVGVLSDITDIKRHESELQKRNDALALAVESSQDIARELNQAMRRLAERIAQAAEGATHQNARATETVGAVSAMTDSAHHMADLAGEAALSAEDAKGAAQEGAGLVQTAVQAIAAAQAQVLDLQEKMRELGVQADNVGKVLQVIGDIADQTNLLALNAAIEAARAGDAGRGFAVVADEVRKLAEKTMQATHEVGATLDSIRGGAAQTLKATEQAAREIVESTRLAQSSGASLERIVAIVQGAANQAKAIAEAAGGQAGASAQASRAVAEIEDISSSTARGMEEASSALEDVDRQAASLEELIRGMKD
ncbi:Methyl-accepting chemotaxis protein McpQ [Fundidesulfovibrio magnetotacticus]|uniref:Methyl-accepting chemotaxis protein McpQ n=1 Tax=Fundidesulfovibrio magnetotacticus TaxID=2730080 RepID=A0A6V8LUY9_9BACT|nr:methyl-accepting chemotaxis protein [Fundidesulfovibrio magnetotacticus]GFK93636.1 Methyl-accepting chemotaxis protein McpQ [Fundidesulfovibrio magnetotacticus]